MKRSKKNKKKKRSRKSKIKKKLRYIGKGEVKGRQRRVCRDSAEELKGGSERVTWRH